jgi:hypothetical protein
MDQVPTQVLVFWGLVKPYKGIELFGIAPKNELFRSYHFEIHGKWHHSLTSTKLTLQGLGVEIHDEFLEPARVKELLRRPVLFVLPYKSSSQSGVLYTLLHYGCVFVATDVGDLGDFLRRHGMAELIFDGNDLPSFHKAISFAYSNYIAIRGKLLRIRADYCWEKAAEAIKTALLEKMQHSHTL